MNPELPNASIVAQEPKTDNVGANRRYHATYTMAHLAHSADLRWCTYPKEQSLVVT